MKIKKEMDTKYKQNVDNNKWQTHMCKWLCVVLCCACPLHITSLVIHWCVGKILHSFSRIACKIEYFFVEMVVNVCSNSIH